MTTFVERCIIRGEATLTEDPQDNAIDLQQLRAALELFDAGLMTAGEIVTALNMTGAQGLELDEILATRPGILAAVFDRSAWVGRVMGCLVAGAAANGNGWAGYQTVSNVRAALGLA